MKVTKNILDRLKIWWNLAFEHGDTNVYNECEETCYDLIGKHIEVWKYKKYGRWNDLKVNELCYIPQNCFNTDGILETYYTKDNFQQACNENKVIAHHIYRNIKGEKVEDYFRDLKQQYYEYFMNEPDAFIYKSELSVNMFRALSEEQQEEIYTVLDRKTGKRND